MVLLMFDALKQATETKHVDVDFLMPTGLIIPLNVHFYTSLSEIKKLLWAEAETYPLYSLLNAPMHYTMVCINSEGVLEEILDESLSIYELEPLTLVIRVVEWEGDGTQRALKQQLKSLIGRVIWVVEWEGDGTQRALKQQLKSLIGRVIRVVEWEGDGTQRALKQQLKSLIGRVSHDTAVSDHLEVLDFQQTMKSFADDVVRERKWTDGDNQLTYLYPPSLRNSVPLPWHLKQRLSDSSFDITIIFGDTGTRYTIKVPGESYPRELIQLILDKRALKSDDCLYEVDEYILKVCGQDEYLYGENPLQQFKYMYECLVRRVKPKLVLLLSNHILGTQEQPPVPPRKSRKSLSVPGISTLQGDTLQVFGGTLARKVSLWHVEDKVAIRAECVGNVDIEDGSKVKVIIGLYYGSENLCPALSSSESTIADGKAVFDCNLEFNMTVQDIPAHSRLCCSLYCKSPTTKSKKDYAPVAWVNLPMFDFRNRLRRGKSSLYMWPVKDDMLFDDMCYSIGSVSQNPYSEHCTYLELNFSDYNQKAHIVHPTHDEILNLAVEQREDPKTPGFAKGKGSKAYVTHLKSVLERDPLYTLHEQDKDLVWVLRYEVMQKFPDGLPKLLASVKWKCRRDVAEMHSLLDTWPEINTDVALELLDFAYPNREGRDLALQCLGKNFTDEDVSQYMLQLVQALKYELYLSCPLVEFLLTNALKNQRLGHQLFWLLRSEMSNPTVSLHYGLILESYCRANQDHMVSLIRQSEALHKLSCVNEMIQNAKFNVTERRQLREHTKEIMHQVMEGKQYNDALCNLQCPLTPAFRLANLCVKKCKFMDSKKRPLWLVWENFDTLGDDVFMLYKRGDDLRQDMLTLQIIGIMDSLWQSNGLDLRMTPYRCLATGNEEGMIEVVLKSQTIANIMKEYDKNAFNKKSLYLWLKKHNTTDDSLTAAIQEFTLSCAGYCVATYVLGIGDRHSDNIMVKESGQLFHIDFGHFLGNFKSKFGVKRERVPFILTDHFVYVLTEGGGKRHESFKRFREHCEHAYLILRRNSNLIISLFMLMLPTGIPQLSCIQDIEYLRQTLALNMTQQEARQHFNMKLDEALNKSYMTSINWQIHNTAKNNV